MTHASVFSGIGGPEVAATMLGWENLFHCEINEFGRRVLDYWFPNSKSYEDITKSDFSEWRGKVDVLTGGFPCQPFSYAGKRRGADDDRYLWPFMFKAIDQIRPTWVVAENVAGITTMVEQGEVSEMGGQASLFEEVDGLHRYRLAETFTLQRICDDLEGHGYSVQPVLIPACAVGAPHRRDRVFIVARRKDRVEGETQYKERSETGRLIADTESDGNSRKPRQIYREDRRPPKLNAKPCIYGEVQSSTYAESEQSGRCEYGQTQCRQPKQGELGGRSGKDVTRRNIAGLGRWDSFPTVSPIHRGNDGIPFDVDSLSIPFSKWRNESLKAYGNAIVPQVMYEIFRAIELANRSL